jgi:hypothetical protein
MPSRGRNGHFGSRQCTGQLVVRHGERKRLALVVELFAGPVWCSGVQSKNSQACIALLQVKAKESNIQRARARGLRKNAKKASQGLVWWVTSDAPSARQLRPITFSSESACSRVLFAPVHTAHAARPGTRHRRRRPWPQGVDMPVVRVAVGDAHACRRQAAAAASR